MARLYYSGNNNKGSASSSDITRLAKGFEFASGICKDSKGNIFFVEPRFRRIYKWSVETNSVSLIADFPWEPWSLACDTKDNLLVSFKYVPRPGYLKDGKAEIYPQLPDAAGTSFSGWGNSGFGILAYSIDPNNAEETVKLLPTVAMGSINNISKALYPAGKWRDYHDFNTISVRKPTDAYLAPDGITIIPVVYDLARSAAMVEAFPGKTVYASDEYDKRTVQMLVDKDGYLSDLKYFAETAESNSAVDTKGNVYIADGDIQVFDKQGKFIKKIKVPERPVTIAFAGKNNQSLFITTNTSLYVIDIAQ